MAENSIKLFGFEIKRAETDDPKKKPSIVPARDEDGAGYVTAAGTHYGQYINLDGDDAKDNYNLIINNMIGKKGFLKQTESKNVFI